MQASLQYTELARATLPHTTQLVGSMATVDAAAGADVIEATVFGDMVMAVAELAPMLVLLLLLDTRKSVIFGCCNVGRGKENVGEEGLVQDNGL